MTWNINYRILDLGYDTDFILHVQRNMDDHHESCQTYSLYKCDKIPNLQTSALFKMDQNMICFRPVVQIGSYGDEIYAADQMDKI